MGSECFVHHAFGVLLDVYDEELAKHVAASIQLQAFRDQHAAEDQMLVDEGVLSASPTGAGLKFRDWLVKDLAPSAAAGSHGSTVTPFYRARVISTLTLAGIRPMNSGWDLFWTGHDHAARCNVAEDTVIVGYGMMNNPWKMGRSPSKAFLAACAHHTWAELG